MPVVYHLNKKQTARLFHRLNHSTPPIYLESIERLVSKESISQHSPYKPRHIYVADDEGGRETSYILEYVGTIDDTRPIFGNVVYAYGDKTYAKLPAEKKLTDAQVDAIVL